MYIKSFKQKLTDDDRSPNPAGRSVLNEAALQAAWAPSADLSHPPLTVFWGFHPAKPSGFNPQDDWP